MNGWTARHQPFADWLRANGYVQEDPPEGNWCIAWSTRIGIDFTNLEFYPWTNRAGVPCVDAIVGCHASGTNPRLNIGTCESLDDIATIHGAIQRINGYPERAEPDLIVLPKLPGWCPQCHTREASKHEAPYCSTICKEAAERAALYDRR
jgi:hypothetical protein